MPIPNLNTDERGFSLLEMLIVVAIFSFVVGYAVSRANRTARDTRAAERALSATMRVLEARRAAAVRLNANPAPTELETFALPPVEIDFANLATTRRLVVDGTDSNADGIDDHSGARLTRPLPPSAGEANGTWDYAYEGGELALPAGWRVVVNPANLRVPQIGGGGGRGAGRVRFAFDSVGRALAYNAEEELFERVPQGAVADSATAAASPFWALYLVDDTAATAAGADRPRNSVASGVVAIAIHPSGLFERFRWDGSGWQGFARRTVESVGE